MNGVSFISNPIYTGKVLKTNNAVFHRIPANTQTYDSFEINSPKRYSALSFGAKLPSQQTINLIKEGLSQEKIFKIGSKFFEEYLMDAIESPYAGKRLNKFMLSATRKGMENHSKASKYGINRAIKSCENFFNGNSDVLLQNVLFSLPEEKFTTIRKFFSVSYEAKSPDIVKQIQNVFEKASNIQDVKKALKEKFPGWDESNFYLFP